MKINNRIADNIPFYLVEGEQVIENVVSINDEFMNKAVGFSDSEGYETSRMREIAEIENVNIVINEHKQENMVVPKGVFKLDEYVNEDKFDMDLFKEHIEIVAKEISQEAPGGSGRLDIGVTNLYAMFDKLNVEYKSEDAKNLVEYIGASLANMMLYISASLAEEHGVYEGYDEKYVNSKFVSENANPLTHELVRRIGLRNTNLLNVFIEDESSKEVPNTTKIVLAAELQRHIDGYVYTSVAVKDEEAAKRLLILAWLEELKFINIRRA